MSRYSQQADNGLIPLAAVPTTKTVMATKNAIANAKIKQVAASMKSRILIYSQIEKLENVTVTRYSQLQKSFEKPLVRGLKKFWKAEFSRSQKHFEKPKKRGF